MMATERTNDDRADDAAKALALASNEGDDTEVMFVDALANLMHLAKREGVDFQEAVLKATEHFDVEVEEESSDEKCRSCGHPSAKPAPSWCDAHN